MLEQCTAKFKPSCNKFRSILLLKIDFNHFRNVIMLSGDVIFY